MPIKSSPFGKIVLTGEDAERFIRHMNEDKPNPVAKASLERGSELLKQIAAGESFKLKMPKNLHKTS